MLVDGFSVMAFMTRNHPEHAATLRREPVTGQYRGDGVILEATRPIFRDDDTGAPLQISFNNYDRADLPYAGSRTDRLYEAMRVADTLLNSRERQWRHTLRAGQALVIDNWRILHGREAFSGSRRMRGAYVNREDFERALRLL